MVKQKNKKVQNVPKNKGGKRKNKKFNDCTLKMKTDPLDVPIKLSIDLYSNNSIKQLLHQIPPKTETNIEINDLTNKLQTIQLGKSKIRRNTNLDKTLKDKFEIPQNQDLPIFEKREEILNLINNNQVIVIYSEQNCGKTIQIPQFILDDMIENEKGSLCKILSTQPYKNKVINAFKKISEQRKSLDMNYQIRFENYKKSNKFTLFFCTAGILLKKITDNLFLNEVSHLIIDEIQERDTSTDILLGLMKEIIKNRKDFKLILMCSTSYSKKIVKYFDGCPKIGVTPEIVPIDEYYLEDIIMLTNFNNLASFEKYEKKKDMHKKYPISVTNFVKTYELHRNTNCYMILSLINHLFFKTKHGNILVLIPNKSDVNFLQEKIQENNTLKSKAHVITNFQNEEEIKFNTNRKIFLTVNEKFVPINESKILYVINSGRVNISTKNANIKKKYWISKKTLRERQKIAGRYNNGTCFNLFSQSSQENFDKYPPAQIIHRELDQTILQIKYLGIDNTELFLQNCLTCPDIYEIRKTIEIYKLNMIVTIEEKLTSLGTMVTKLPLSQSQGRMVLLGTLFSCLKPVLIIAAYSNFNKNIFSAFNDDLRNIKLTIGGKSDILLLIDLMKKFESSGLPKKQFFTEYNIDESVIDTLENIMKQITSRLHQMKLMNSLNYNEEKFNINSNNTNLINSLLCIALHPNIAVVRKHNYKELKDAPIETIFNNKVYLQKSSINYEKIANSPLIIYRNIIQLKRMMINETTIVRPIQVVIFANDVTFTENDNETIIIVAEILKIYCSKNCANIIQSVRKNFQEWLNYKLSCPGFVDWNENNWDTLTMKSVLQLLRDSF